MKSLAIKSGRPFLGCAALGLSLLLIAPAIQAAGLVTKLVFTTQPGLAVNGQPLGVQPVVQTADANGTPSTVGLPAHLNVTIKISAGSGTLTGTTMLDIGTAAGNGTATYTNLAINSGGSGTVLTATCAGGQLTSATANLSHRWNFNDPGTNFTDSVGGVMAQLIGGGSSLTNIGVTLFGNNYIDLAGNGTAGTNHLIQNLPSGSVTFEAWLTYGDNHAGQRIFDIGMSDAGQGYAGNANSGISLTAIDGGNGGHPASVVTTNGSLVALIEDTSYLVDTNQHYWAVTYDPNTPTWQLWLDGVLRSTNSTGGALPALTNLNDLNAWLGLSQNTNDALLVGIYNEFRIWDGLLGSSDITNHNAAGAGQQLTGSASVSFDVLTAPSVWLSGSNNITANAGQTAVFNASAAGSTPLGYQWYFNTNTLLSGATSLTLTLTNVQAGNAGTYRVVATNAAGSATSGNAVLSVNLPPPAPTNLIAVPGDKQVSLSWAPVNGATRYNVKESLTNGGPYTVFTNLSGAGCVRSGLVNGTTYYYVVSATNSVGEGSNSAQASAALLLTYTNIASGNWSSSGNWASPPGAPSSGGGASTAILFKSNAPDNSTNDLTGAFILNQMTLTGTNAVTNSAVAGSSLLFTNNSVILPVLTNASSKTLVINSPVTLGNNLTVGVTSGSSTVINSIISDGGANFSLTKSGPGILTLTGTNTFTGGLVVNTGTVRLSGTQSFTGGVTLNGGTLGDNGGGSVQITAAALNGNSITVPINASAGFKPAIGETFTNSITINSGASLAMGPGTQANGTVNYNGVIAGTGTLDSGNINQQDTIVLGNTSNTFSGNVLFHNGQNFTLNVSCFGDSGKVTISNHNGTAIFNLGSSATAPLTFNTRQFQFVGALGNLQMGNYSAQPFTINTSLDTSAATAAKIVTLAGTGAGLSAFGGTIANGSNNLAVSLTKIESGTWTLSGTNTYTGPTTISGGTLTIGGSGQLGSGAYAGRITNNAAFKYASSVSQTLGGILSGSGALIQSGPGTLTLTGPNTYTGPTTISGGSLTIGGSGQLGGGAYAGRITNNAVFNYASSASQTLAGTISGTGNLIQAGSGTVTLTGTNTYTGPTTISSGSLTIGGSGQLGSGNYTGNLANNGAFTYASSASQTLSGVISGSGTLTQSGPGMLTLAGANTFNGVANITGGTLAFTVSASNQFSPAVLYEGTGGGQVQNVFTNVFSTTTAPVNVGTLVLNGTVTLCILNPGLVIGQTYPLISFTNLTGSGHFEVKNTLGDYWRSFNVLTNGNTIALTCAAPQDVAVVSVTQTLTNSGGWQVDGSAIVCTDRRGYVEYAVDVTTANRYNLVVIGTQNTAGCAADTFKLQLSIDGTDLGWVSLIAGYGTNTAVGCLTPFLPAGSHTVRVFWDNVANLTSLRIKSVKLQALGELDEVAAWIKELLAQENTMDTVVSSLTSPACVQGDGKYPNLMSLTATSSGSGAATNISVQAAPNDRWFANAPLDFTNNMQLVLAAENGALTVTQQLSWATSSVLNGGTLMIRKGDSLLLNAAPAGATNGSVTLTVSGVPYTTPPANPLPIAFTNAGNFTVTGVYTSGTNVLSNAVVVKVLDCALPQNPAVCVGNARIWDVPAFSTNIVLDMAAKLSITEGTSPTNTLRRFTLNAPQALDYLVAARIGTNGPVLGATTVHGLNYFESMQTYNQVIQVYPDGTKLVETLLVMSPLPADISIQMNIFVAGVTFEDGTIAKTLTAADFDSLGRCKVRFLKAKGVVTSNCHNSKIYQNGVLLGTF